MSQLTAVRTASRTADTAQWWHLSVFTGGFDVADGIIGELVTPLAAQAQMLGATRWFYTRCDEPACAHVRMDVLTHPRSVERLQAFHRSLQAQAGGMLPQLTVRQHFSAPVEVPSSVFASEETGQCVEGDLVRFGGAEGLQLAEQVFQLSSHLAAWGSQRFMKMHNRSAFGALILFDSARSMMNGPRSAGSPGRRATGWDPYWNSHLETCTGDLGHLASRARAAMAAQVKAKSPAFHGLMAATAADPTVQNWRRRWFRALDTYLHRAEKARVDRTAQQLSRYQAHMTLNRLGFNPREEGALGLYARTWSVEREKLLSAGNDQAASKRPISPGRTPTKEGIE